MYGAKWGEIDTKLHRSTWNVGEPKLKSGECVAGHKDSYYSMVDCDKKLPFVCESNACLEGRE